MGLVVQAEKSIPLRSVDDLPENSGAAASTSQPGVFFTINDSGNDPVLFAFDTTGADRGRWRVEGTRNVDWEAVSTGPCAAPDTTSGVQPDGARCVYVGDVGDNNLGRRSVTVYRVREPAAGVAGSEGTLDAESLSFTYSDAPHNVEAIYVGPDAAMTIISKETRKNDRGEHRGALVFRIAADAWNTDAPAVAVLVDSLPILLGSAPMRDVTDAALSPDARFVAVRTYAQVYVFAADPATGMIRRDVAPTTCNISGLGELQGEGIGWYSDGQRLLLTSEQSGALLHTIRCPGPGPNE